MLIISSSIELLFDRFNKTSIVTESVDVVLIRHRNSHIPYTGSDTVDNVLDSWESLMATTLFYFIHDKVLIKSDVILKSILIIIIFHLKRIS